MILRATPAKLAMLKDLETEGEHALALGDYLRATDEVRTRIAEEAVPAGLAPFATEVLQALERQQVFFRAAAEARARGVSLADVYRHPDGRRASQLLVSAWGRMHRRYPGWSPEMQDSVYHHLCALDLF
jgi:hypothetical protein